MKRLTALLAVFLCLNVVPVHAATPKVLAIIDTGVDIQHPAIKNNIVYEVCVATYKTCPNGQNFMEGAGAATISPTLYSDPTWGKYWAHGTEVASAATQTDPNVKIIEIRCAAVVPKTNIIVMCWDDAMKIALDWIANNKDKFNIGAVVAPFAKPSTIGGTVALPCNTTGSYVSSINNLVNAGMPIIFPSGNEFNYANVDNPACLNGVLAISAIDDKGRLALYANYSPRVDFAASGNLQVAYPGNQYKSDSGTSFSVAVFGADWLRIANAKSISYQDEYNLIKNTSDPYTNIMVKKNVLAINIAKAIQ